MLRKWQIVIKDDTKIMERTDGVIGTVDLGQVNLTTSHSVRSFGVIADDSSSFNEQFNRVCKLANFHLRALRWPKIRDCIYKDTAKLVAWLMFEVLTTQEPSHLPWIDPVSFTSRHLRSSGWQSPAARSGQTCVRWQSVLPCSTCGVEQFTAIHHCLHFVFHFL